MNALDLVPSNNDLLAKNIMDDGRIRIIDYDFSGMNDPMFDVGDLAMEGDYDPDQVAAACEAYFGAHDPVQFARARLFGIAAQYTWSLLFVGWAPCCPRPRPRASTTGRRHRRAGTGPGPSSRTPGWRP